MADIFNGAPPQDVTGAISSVSGMPDWYQEYLRGIAGQGAAVAGQGFQQYPDPRLAGFNTDQTNAFDLTRDQTGQYTPYMQSAVDSASQSLPTASAFLGQGAQYGQQATDATAGPAATWTGNWQQYMSPYTSSVVNEIGRLGNQNLQENILQPTMSSFVGSGGFGSDRNADMIGRNIRDAQSNISGLQAQALESGYSTAGNLFNQDATRQQQQQQLQANTNLGAGQLSNAGAQIGAAAADQSAARYGALGQLGQTLGYQDAGALGAIGGAQQGLQQQGYDLGYQNFQNQQNWNWNQLGNLSSLVRGLPMPNGQTSVTNQPLPGGNVGTSPLQWAGMLYGLSPTQQAPAVQSPG